MSDTSMRDKTVLVIDSSSDVREQLKTMLTKYGYRVVTASSEQEGSGYLRGGEAVDLLLFEMGSRAPGKRSAVADMRSVPGCEEMPIIALAEPGLVGEVAHWLDSGCSDFLLKPVDARLLFQRVQALVEDHPRAYNRVDCSVIAGATTGTINFNGELAEIGEGGAGFVVDRELPCGDILKLNFHLPGQPADLVVGAEIIYVRPVGERFLHGLRFIIIDRATREKIRTFVLKQLDVG